MVVVGCTGWFAMLLLWFGVGSEWGWLGGWTLLPIWVVLVWVVGDLVFLGGCEFWVGSGLVAVASGCCCSLSFVCCLRVRRVLLCGLC